MSIGQRLNNKNRLYRVWAAVIQRCENPHHERYKDYGGRGIKLCEEWRRDYRAFEKWAYEHGYDDNAEIHQCSLDRIDNGKDYSPDNCRFVNNREQCNNKRNNKKITIKETTHTIQEWSRIVGIPDYVIRDRIKKLHWNPVEAVLTPRLPLGARR